MSIRVVVADDQEMIRAGFAMILEAQDDIDVVGEAADGEAAVAETARLDPDVLVMDIQMPGLDGIAATRAVIDRAPPAPRVLIVTTFDVDEYVYGALHAGASGFLLKNAPPEELVRAVRVIAAGDSLLSPEVTTRLIKAFALRTPATRTPPPALEELTPREREVLGLVARGLSNGEIADELVVSRGTVKTHVERILMKLGLRDRIQAVVLAYETGIVTPGHIPPSK